jgi:hypothetical protein
MDIFERLDRDQSPRELFLLVALGAVALGWYVDHRHPDSLRKIMNTIDDFARVEPPGGFVTEIERGKWRYRVSVSPLSLKEPGSPLLRSHIYHDGSLPQK